MVIGIGNSKAISTSKIMKITAIRKNRDEKGSRAEFFGSNPHSNGDLFSRSSLFFFFEISVVRAIMAILQQVVLTMTPVMYPFQRIRFFMRRADAAISPTTK